MKAQAEVAVQAATVLMLVTQVRTMLMNGVVHTVVLVAQVLVETVVLVAIVALTEQMDL
jgi:hypothetical protein